MANNYQRHQNKLRRRYTFTKTKAVVGFAFSTFLSIILSTYFDIYGVRMIQQGRTFLRGTSEAVVESSARPEKAIVEDEVSGDRDISELRRMIRKDY